MAISPFIKVIASITNQIRLVTDPKINCLSPFERDGFWCGQYSPHTCHCRAMKAKKQTQEQQIERNISEAKSSLWYSITAYWVFPHLQRRCRITVSFKPHCQIYLFAVQLGFLHFLEECMIITALRSYKLYVMYHKIGVISVQTLSEHFWCFWCVLCTNHI